METINMSNFLLISLLKQYGIKKLCTLQIYTPHFYVI